MIVFAAAKQAEEFLLACYSLSGEYINGSAEGKLNN